MKAGAHDYVMKDNLARLCATVERGLDEARGRRERRRRRRSSGGARRSSTPSGSRRSACSAQPSGWEESVRAVLRRLGEAAAVSRVYVFENLRRGGRRAVERRAPQVGWRPGVAPGAGGRRRYWRQPGRGSGPDGTSAAGRRFSVGGSRMHGNTRDFPESERPFLAGSSGYCPWSSCRSSSRGGGGALSGSTSARSEREWSAAEIGRARGRGRHPGGGPPAQAGRGGAARQRGALPRRRSSRPRTASTCSTPTAKRLLETNPSFQGDARLRPATRCSGCASTTSSPTRARTSTRR